MDRQPCLKLCRYWRFARTSRQAQMQTGTGPQRAEQRRKSETHVQYSWRDNTCWKASCFSFLSWAFTPERHHTPLMGHVIFRTECACQQKSTNERKLNLWKMGCYTREYWNYAGMDRRIYDLFCA